MVQLVDIDTAKKHLRIEINDDDERLQIAIEQASSIVLDYLKLDEAPNPVPGNIEAATLLSVEALFDGTGDPLSDTVKNLLHRKRDPEFA